MSGYEPFDIEVFYQAKENHQWYFSDGVEAIGPWETEHEARIEAALYDFYAWRHDFHQGDGDVHSD